MNNQLRIRKKIAGQALELDGEGLPVLSMNEPLIGESWRECRSALPIERASARPLAKIS
jgi:hypothetical protein